MSRIEAQPFRVDRDNLIRIRVYISYIDCEGISIQFKSDETPNIVSTSAGMILGNEVKTSGVPEYIQLFIDRSNSSEYECLISYLNGASLVHSESLTFKVDKPASLSPTPIEISSIKGDGNSWETRINQFIEVVKGRRKSSLWQVFLYCTNDIVATIKTKSNKRCFMAFGVDSDLVLHSDYLFPVDNKTKKIVIPAEVFWKNYDKYNSTQSQVACFELIRPDFLSLQNVFYKRRISNWLNVADIPKIKWGTIKNFSSPTGVLLGDQWVISDKTGLPVYNGTITSGQPHVTS